MELPALPVLQSKPIGSPAHQPQWLYPAEPDIGSMELPAMPVMLQTPSVLRVPQILLI